MEQDELTVAHVNGVGTTWEIRLESYAPDAGYRILVGSGPATKFVAGGLTWREAMDRVRDQVEEEITAEAAPPPAKAEPEELRAGEQMQCQSCGAWTMNGPAHICTRYEGPPCSTCGKPTIGFTVGAPGYGSGRECEDRHVEWNGPHGVLEPEETR